MEYSTTIKFDNKICEKLVVVCRVIGGLSLAADYFSRYSNKPRLVHYDGDNLEAYDAIYRK